MKSNQSSLVELQCYRLNMCVTQRTIDLMCMLPREQPVMLFLFFLFFVFCTLGNSKPLMTVQN